MCESQRLLLASTLRFPMYGNTAPAPEGVGLELLKHRQCFGGHSERETPGHIPNPEAKTLSADGTAGATPWESRTPPDFLSERAAQHRAALSCLSARQNGASSSSV